MNGLTAVVLAGGGRDDVCRYAPDAVNKAFVSVGGVALVTRTLRALREASTIRHIIVVAPPGAPAAPLALADERREDGACISDSLSHGLRGLPPEQLVVLAAADLPVLTPMAVDDFAERAIASNADLAYGYLDRRIHDRRYAGMRHTWARLREGTFCGTGLSAVRPDALAALLSVLESAAVARKAPWRLASLLGIGILARYALGILGIAELEARASALLARRACGIPSEFAESAVNIDRYADLRYFETAPRSSD